MTFKELLAQYCFAEIRHPFLCLWQTNEPKLVERLDLEKWEYIYIYISESAVVGANALRLLYRFGKPLGALQSDD